MGDKLSVKTKDKGIKVSKIIYVNICFSKNSIIMLNGTLRDSLANIKLHCLIVTVIYWMNINWMKLNLNEITSLLSPLIRV